MVVRLSGVSRLREGGQRLNTSALSATPHPEVALGGALEWCLVAARGGQRLNTSTLFVAAVQAVPAEPTYET